MNSVKTVGIVFILLALASCSQRQSKQQQTAARFKTYKGTVNVFVDAGFETVMQQEKEVFEFHYDSVTANLQYMDEPGVINAYRQKRTGVMILDHELDSITVQNLQKNDTLFIRQLPVAYDAVALVANPGFDDSELDSVTLQKYFDPHTQGKNTPALVFDKQSTGLIRFMVKKLGLGSSISPNLFAVATTDDVISYVQQNKNAIGFVPFNYMSDTNNEKVKRIYDRIKVLSLRAKTQKGEAIRVSANQSDIAEGIYPFIRPIVAITHYGYDDDLEWLFVYFIHRDKGSKVFLKHGLIPAKRTEREINVNTDGLKARNE
jgi:phosphate transport system substrate-binding protein